jgi:hypothetical protein
VTEEDLFYSLPNWSRQTLAPTSLYSMGTVTGRIFPTVKRPEREAGRWVPLPRIGMSGTRHSLRHMALQCEQHSLWHLTKQVSHVSLFPSNCTTTNIFTYISSHGTSVSGSNRNMAVVSLLYLDFIEQSKCDLQICNVRCEKSSW